jgi:hypothetical protein
MNPKGIFRFATSVTAAWGLSTPQEDKIDYTTERNLYKTKNHMTISSQQQSFFHKSTNNLERQVGIIQ